MRAKALRYTLGAAKDLTDIRAYLTGHGGKRVASAVITRLRAAIKSAREMPKAGAPRPEYRPNCRCVFEQPYIIYYDFDGQVMVVLRILHQARDRDRIMQARPDNA